MSYDIKSHPLIKCLTKFKWSWRWKQAFQTTAYCIAIETDKRYRTQKNKKLAFLKEKVENADYKSIMNKIMTTQEECIKYNFVAPFLSF